jgi:hypothetical protein
MYFTIYLLRTCGHFQKNFAESFLCTGGAYCSMQMLTDWSRTMFPNVVFTSNIIKVIFSDSINCLLVRNSYFCIDRRIVNSNNTFTHVLSVDAIVLYLKDLQGRPKYAQFYVRIFISKTTLKSISSLTSSKIISLKHYVKGVLCEGCARSIRDARSQAQQL